MSEKRFTYRWGSDIDYEQEIFYDNHKPIGFVEVVGLLNEQQSTNDYLEESNSRLQVQLGETLRLFDKLKEENEQLKNDDLLFFQQVFNILMKYQHLFNREMADEVLEDLGIELTEWFE